MQEEYNWNLILKVAIPFALIEAYIFYANIIDAWKWISLAFGLFSTGIIVYMTNKRKSNIFTAVGLVFLAALIVRFLRDFGIV